MKKNHPHDIAAQGITGNLRLSLAAAAVTALFGTAPALAEPLFQYTQMPKPDMSRWTDNYVEVGAGGVATDSASGKAFKFGEYTGLKDDDAFAIVGFNWIFNSRENDAIYFRTNASNLGLETRKLSVEGGEQGKWGVSFSADRLLRSEIDSARFMYDGLGSSNLTNPLPRPTNATLAASFTNEANYKPFDIEQGRDIYRLGLRGILSANWDFRVNYREDVRDGNRLTGLPFCNGCGTRSAAVIPYEINDKTQVVEATLGYQSPKVEGQLAYNYSRYENQLDRFRVDNIQSTTTVTHPVSQMSLMPDNEFHQINLTGAYNFTKDTRAKALLSYGVALQNETFLPYNSAGAGITTGAPLPRQSLDGKMINTLADLSLMTKPTEKMNLKLAYQYRDVDNETPRNTYIYASRDAAQPAVPLAAASAANQRQNAPVSTTEQRVTIDGDYAIAARTQLRALIEHTITDYTLSDRTQTKTSKGALDLRRTFADEFIGNLGYAFTQRTGSAYDKNTYFRETYTGTFASTAAGTLTNHPSMRSFMYNDYDENRVRASGNWTATETISAGASIDAYGRQYKGDNCGKPVDPNVIAFLAADPLPDTCLGTRKAQGGNLNLDLQWQPDEELMAFTFITLSQTRTDIDGRGPWVKNAAAATNSLDNTALNWSGRLVYDDQTFGLGTKWQATAKWELGGQYAYSYGVGKTDVRLATVAGANMPDLKSELHNVNLFAKWAYSSRLTFRFNYLYERLKTKDWSYDNLTPTSNAGLLLTGQTSPKYENHVLGASVAISTW